MIYSKCFFILFTQLKPYIIQLIQSHVNLVSFWWNIFWSWKNKLYKIIFEYKKVVEQFFQSLNDIRNYGDIKEEITFILILQIKIFNKLLFFISRSFNNLENIYNVTGYVEIVYSSLNICFNGTNGAEDSWIHICFYGYFRSWGFRLSEFVYPTEEKR